jgi:hypothetical protein
MKQFYKPLLLLASFLSIENLVHAKFSKDNLSLSFEKDAISFHTKEKKNISTDDKTKHETALVQSNQMSLKLFLRSVGGSKQKQKTVIAGLHDEQTNVSSGLANEEKNLVAVENFEVNCIGKKQYWISWNASSQKASGSFVVRYRNSKNKLINLYQTSQKNGVKVNYTALLNLPEAIDEPMFEISKVDETNHFSMLATTVCKTDKDGEMVRLLNENNQIALAIKTVENTGGIYSLTIFDESGNKIIGEQEIEIMAGSSQIIPMDIPTTEHGNYVAVLSNSTGSKKKKKAFKISY